MSDTRTCACGMTPDPGICQPEDCALRVATGSHCACIHPPFGNVAREYPYRVIEEPIIPLHERVDYWIEEAEQALNMVAWLAETGGNAALQTKAEDLEEAVRWLIQWDHQVPR